MATAALPAQQGVGASPACVLIQVNTTTAATGSPVGSGDYPFNIFALVRLTDTNALAVIY